MGQETILMKYLPLTEESGNPQEENVLIFNNPGEKDKYELTPVFTNTFMLLLWKEYLYSWQHQHQQEANADTKALAHKEPDPAF